MHANSLTPTLALAHTDVFLVPAQVASKRVGTAEWEKHLQLLASEDLLRGDAASRMARKWMARRDAKRVADALETRDGAKVLVERAVAALAGLPLPWAWPAL